MGLRDMLGLNKGADSKLESAFQRPRTPAQAPSNPLTVSPKVAPEPGRTPLTIPVRITGKDSSGRSFSEQTRTLWLEQNRVRIVTVEDVGLGTDIVLESLALGRSDLAKVVWKADIAMPGQPFEIDLELLDIFDSEGDWAADYVRTASEGPPTAEPTPGIQLLQTGPGRLGPLPAAQSPTSEPRPASAPAEDLAPETPSTVSSAEAVKSSEASEAGDMPDASTTTTSVTNPSTAATAAIDIAGPPAADGDPENPSISNATNPDLEDHTEPCRVESESPPLGSSPETQAAVHPVRAVEETEETNECTAEVAREVSRNLDDEAEEGVSRVGSRLDELAQQMEARLEELTDQAQTHWGELRREAETSLASLVEQQENRLSEVTAAIQNLRPSSNVLSGQREPDGNGRAALMTSPQDLDEFARQIEDRIWRRLEGRAESAVKQVMERLEGSRTAARNVEEESLPETYRQGTYAGTLDLRRLARKIEDRVVDEIHNAEHSLSLSLTSLDIRLKALAKTPGPNLLAESVVKQESSEDHTAWQAREWAMHCARTVAAQAPGLWEDLLAEISHLLEQRRIPHASFEAVPPHGLVIHKPTYPAIEMSAELDASAQEVNCVITRTARRGDPPSRSQRRLRFYVDDSGELYLCEGDSILNVQTAARWMLEPLIHER